MQFVLVLSFYYIFFLSSKWENDYFYSSTMVSFTLFALCHSCSFIYVKWRSLTDNIKQIDVKISLSNVRYWTHCYFIPGFECVFVMVLRLIKQKKFSKINPCDFRFLSILLFYLHYVCIYFESKTQYGSNLCKMFSGGVDKLFRFKNYFNWNK